ncbi:beta-ketoacyl-[acyl-carrier-protein] synthase family protein [Pontiella desulfatans]|uniref:beta-ketoacyl-[acyl-carrier-protein] synthase family protein n=1 Tax=Pontiella desulfatans TaxID=2750659 RepID=UPI0014449A2F|nr:beta-ketoacyl-[acyl-carrier-protein] synthase family protein [Pontiella desulfatans]
MIGRNRVVITGLGVLAANGIGKEAFWKSLLAGESGIGPITQFDASEIPWQIAGEIDGFSPTDFIDPSLKPKRQSRNTQIAAAATVMALEDAKLSMDSLKKVEPVQITLGISLGGLDLVEQHTRRLVEKGAMKGLPTVSACVHIIASSFISALLKVKTQINVVSNSCTGGLDAIAAGAAAIRRGEVELAIVGGTDAVIIPSVVTGLGFAGMLTDSHDNPKTISRPFDLTRCGGVLAEGTGIVILESLNHARERGARQYAEISAHGTASGINMQLHEGLETSMRRAMSNAGLYPQDISNINAHGTSDPDLDIAETVAIKNVLGSHAYNIPINSIKGSTGNPLAAGGALQVISSCLSMEVGIIPPTTNLRVPDPDCDLDYVPETPRHFEPSVTLINSHGTGGVNSSMVLEKIKQ